MNSIHCYLPFNGDHEWQMGPAEQIALVGLASVLRPALSVETGSRFGGSLAVLSQYSERVISVDIDPTVPERLGRFSNVEFVTGDSKVALPLLLGRLADLKTPVGLALIDGDRSTAGARKDCQAFLGVPPCAPLYILIHDSFNPEVREGIRTAGWEDCPYVQSLEMDLVPGTMFPAGPSYREMWGGFSLAVLDPQKREGKLVPTAEGEAVYRSARVFSMHNIVTRRALQLKRLLHLA